MIGYKTTSGQSREMRNVYFAQRLNGGPIKIGCTKTPDLRLQQLQREFFADIHFLACVPGRMADEITLHKIFASDRIVDEWFKPSLHLVAFIEMAAKIAEIPAPYRWEAPPERKMRLKRKPRETSKESCAKLVLAKKALAARLKPIKEAGRAVLRAELSGSSP